MTEKEKYQKIAQEKFEGLGPAVILFAYQTHLLDLQAQLIKDLSTAVDTTALPAAAQDRLAQLDDVLAASSIDFDNATAPTEAYKIPGAVNIKEAANRLMKEYQEALAREGLL